jgi:DNA topoisomerase-1
VIGGGKVLKFRETATIKNVASYLGNTVAVCRKYYVHPLVFEVDASKDLRKIHASLKKSSGLTKEESVLMKILKSHRLSA